MEEVVKTEVLQAFLNRYYPRFNPMFTRKDENSEWEFHLNGKVSYKFNEKEVVIKDFDVVIPVRDFLDNLSEEEIDTLVERSNEDIERNNKWEEYEKAKTEYDKLPWWKKMITIPPSISDYYGCK